ncbi:tol-pal system-associated acyl-CoA thioesterase [Aliikangiella coralliicola]|uniref:Tol-pal system-associated acyl-CoA thioesterase n=1 Tax=Aliikangiella coralliicola TaxID=2592383 RepID=A0A545UBS6_9GAMM|nr:tol-pal system-associated acyl-CoA thioesterase [Aliikangiella coralliicola]TQV86920.1 tol-pal system-associated acyl-CoA thioesterase [Aliikangiella coralliicola]
MSVEFIWPISVYYEDTDAGGVVYHANYLKFFERARSEWLRSLGINQADLFAQDIAFAVKKSDVDYVKPVRFGDEVEVITHLTAIRGASLQFEQKLFLHGDRQQVLCKAEISVVSLKLESFTPCRIPAAVREVLQRVC